MTAMEDALRKMAALGRKYSQRNAAWAATAPGPLYRKHECAPIWSAEWCWKHAAHALREARYNRSIGWTDSFIAALRRARRYRHLAMAGGAIEKMTYAAIGPDGRPAVVTYTLRRIKHD